MATLAHMLTAAPSTIPATAPAANDLAGHRLRSVMDKTMESGRVRAVARELIQIESDARDQSSNLACGKT